MDNTIRRIEQQRRDYPLWQKLGAAIDPQIPPVTNAVLISETYNATAHKTRVVISWDEPVNPFVDHYAVWVRSTSGATGEVTTVQHAPAIIDYGTAETGACTAFIRTVMNNGAMLDLNRCPTVTFTGTV